MRTIELLLSFPDSLSACVLPHQMSFFFFPLLYSHHRAASKRILWNAGGTCAANVSWKKTSQRAGERPRSLSQHVWSLSRLPAACVCLPWRKLGPTVYTTSLPVRLSREAFEMSRDTDKSSSLWEEGGTFQERICPLFM